MNRVEHLAEGVMLYLGDCREVLPTLPPHDATVCDPPYLVSKGGFASNLQRASDGRLLCLAPL